MPSQRCQERPTAPDVVLYALMLFVCLAIACEALVDSDAQSKADAGAGAETQGTLGIQGSPGTPDASDVSSAAKPLDTQTTEVSAPVPAASVKPVHLGTAGGFAILAKSGVSTVPAAKVTGHVAVSPAAATFLTGFSLTADATNAFATSKQVTGKVYAANYAPPTPSQLTTAVGDMQLAFVDAAGRAPNVTELGAGDIGGKMLTPGVYKWGTGLLIPTNVTLNGSATSVWIFQIAKNLTVHSAVKLVLAGGALPKNVFWQVAGAVDIGTTAHFAGVILCKTAITLRTGASVSGRLLAQTAVNIDSSVVVEPTP